MTVADQPVHDKVALRVITFLGSGMILALIGVLTLVHESIQSTNQVDPSTVALVSGVSTLAGTAFGALGSILASTKGTAAQPVEVVNKPEDPIPTQDSTAGTNPVVEIHDDAPATSDL